MQEKGAVESWKVNRQDDGGGLWEKLDGMGIRAVDVPLYYAGRPRERED